MTPSISASPETAAVETERRAQAKAPSRPAAGAQPHSAGMLWLAGWLFTIGFAKLVWWKAILGLLVWPYFLGVFIQGVVFGGAGP